MNINHAAGRARTLEFLSICRVDNAPQRGFLHDDEDQDETYSVIIIHVLAGKFEDNLET